MERHSIFSLYRRIALMPILMTSFRSHLRRFSTLFPWNSLDAESHDTLLQIIINILVVA